MEIFVASVGWFYKNTDTFGVYETLDAAIVALESAPNSDFIEVYKYDLGSSTGTEVFCREGKE